MAGYKWSACSVTPPAPIPPSGLAYAAQACTTIGATATISPSGTVAGDAPLTYSMSPAVAGASINASTGVITFSPTATVAATTITVTVSNAAGSATATVAVQTCAPAVIAPSGLSYTQPACTNIGGSTAISATLAAGTAPITYSISPAVAGAGINASTGLITFAPTAVVAATTVTVTATNSAGSTTATVSLESCPCGAFSFTYGASPACVEPGQSITLTPTITNPCNLTLGLFQAFPSNAHGITVDSATGVITFAPTAAVPDQLLYVGVIASDGQTYFAEPYQTFSVCPPPYKEIFEYAPQPCTTIEQTVTIAPTVTTEGTGTVTYSISPADPNVTIDPSTGVITFNAYKPYA